MSKLLQRAKAFAHKDNYGNRGKFTSKDDVELAVAWAKGEISLSQVAHAYGFPVAHGSKVYCRLAIALRAYVKQQKV